MRRIDYSGTTEPNAETLRSLHRAHLLTVPFENLDIALKRRITVDPEHSVRKIVERHGGTVTARSAVGEGATFIVALPLVQPKVREEENV